ncbi:MAG: hypothetical protein JJE21_07405 [Spirochaetaceae bacterium]|nr:hypothetical protein [Spirochaetaceae bacterium]
MKKGAIISLVFAILSFLIGLIIIVYSLGLILTPMSIQDFNAGVTASITYSSLSVHSLMPLMMIILGCTLFVSAILFFIVSINLFILAKKKL